METMAPCPLEDSTNCYWDASSSGNGVGSSFIDIDGTAYYAKTVTPANDGVSFDWTFDASDVTAESVAHFDDSIVCYENADLDTTCNILFGSDSYVATHTPTATVTVTPTEDPDLLPSTGNDFDPVLASGFALLILFVAASAAAIDKLKKGPRS